MKAIGPLGLGCWLVLVASCLGAEYRVAELSEGPPSGGVAEAIAKQLHGTGIRIFRGAKATYCDIWLTRTRSPTATSSRLRR